MKTTFQRKITIFNVRNPSAEVKPECIKCGYYNTLKLQHYKCYTPGKCPAHAV